MDYSSHLLGKASVRLKNVKGKIIAGFSGGADSTALLSVLIKLCGAENIIALHVNHMLRGADADADEEFCRGFCKARGVEFICKRIDVRSICGDSSVEETARNCRYDAFSEAAERHGADYIALAHTSSDNLETVLFNMCRGSGLSGMRGIPFSRPCGGALIIRPLIDCTRDEILGYDNENGLSFVTDKTNSDTHYTRNFIRAEIVPKIKRLFPESEKAVRNMCDSVSLDYDFIKTEARRFISENTEGGKLPAGKLNAVHPAFTRHVLTELYGGTLESARIIEICSLINSGEDGKITVSGGRFATVRGGYFSFAEEPRAEKRPEFEMKLSRGCGVSPLGFCFCIGEGSAPDGYKFIGEAEIPENMLGSLYARSRRTGDKYSFRGMTRIVKKLIFSLPENAKKIRPVVRCGDNVIWYPGFPAAKTENGDGKMIKIKYYEYSTEVNENV